MKLSLRLMLTLAAAGTLVLALSSGAFAMGGMGGGGAMSGGSGAMRSAPAAPPTTPHSTHEAGTGAAGHGMTTTAPAGGSGSGMADHGAGMSAPAHEPGTGMGEIGHGSGTSMTNVPTGQHMFTDTGGTWFEAYAKHMAENEYMHGYGNGVFDGYDPITRGQFAATMARMLGMDASGEAPFGDTHGYWGSGYVAAMTRAGIISGHADGTFGPNQPITRAQMAELMDRARAYIGEHTADYDRRQLHNQLMDVDGHWAEDAIGHMYELGVAHGDSTGHFYPNQETNRAQAAAMLWRWHEAQ